LVSGSPLFSFSVSAVFSFVGSALLVVSVGLVLLVVLGSVTAEVVFVVTGVCLSLALSVAFAPVSLLVAPVAPPVSLSNGLAMAPCQTHPKMNSTKIPIK